MFRITSRAFSLIQKHNLASNIRGMSSVSVKKPNMPTDDMSQKEVYHISKAHMDYLPKPSGDFQKLTAEYKKQQYTNLVLPIVLLIVLQSFIIYNGYYTTVPTPKMKN